MKKGKHLTLALVALFFFTICLSCGGGGSAVGPATAVNTISWQTDSNGFSQYSTNDIALYATEPGHTNNTIQNTMTYVETQVQRLYGSMGSGYGIAFCYHDRHNTYAVEITTHGSYLIIKRVAGVASFYSGGSWSATKPSPWPTSGNLNTGLGSINTIKVVNVGGGTFHLYFNGIFETSFNDTTFTGGDSGYVVYISDASHESFPNTPSDVLFKQIFPDLATAGGTQRILWQDDGAGFVQFLTNDPNDYNLVFSNTNNPQFTPMNSVEVQTEKMYGNSGSPYGITFCVQDSYNFYRLLITCDGYYLISKTIAGTYYYYVGGGSWTTVTSSAIWLTGINLVSGFDQINKIKVVNTGSGNFDVYFNDIHEMSFVDINFTWGYNGYAAGVSPSNYESFPTPVDVRFKLISAN